MLATRNFGDWHAVVSEVSWSSVAKTMMDCHSKLVLHSLRNNQPVQVVMHQPRQTTPRLVQVDHDHSVAAQGVAKWCSCARWPPAVVGTPDLVVICLVRVLYSPHALDFLSSCSTCTALILLSNWLNTILRVTSLYQLQVHITVESSTVTLSHRF